MEAVDGGFKVHINPPQFLIICIEDAKTADKLFYSFQLGPFVSEISLFKHCQKSILNFPLEISANAI